METVLTFNDGGSIVNVSSSMVRVAPPALERVRGLQVRRRRAHPDPREGVGRSRHHGKRGGAGGPPRPRPSWAAPRLKNKNSWPPCRRSAVSAPRTTSPASCRSWSGRPGGGQRSGGLRQRRTGLTDESDTDRDGGRHVARRQVHRRHRRQQRHRQGDRAGRRRGRRERRRRLPHAPAIRGRGHSRCRGRRPRGRGGSRRLAHRRPAPGYPDRRGELGRLEFWSATRVSRPARRCWRRAKPTSTRC